MKKVYRYILCTLLLGIGMVLTASALQLGDVIGWAEYTDTKVYINDAPIRAYSIEGELCVVAEDLAHYGFNIGYYENTRSLQIWGVSRYKTATQITPVLDAGKAGTRAMPYLHTDIDTIMNKDAYWHTRATAYNIGGYTCVRVEDIAEYYTTRCVRNEAANEIRLYLHWEFKYTPPEYDAMAETEGDYVILEFTQKDGEFFLTYAEGATLCLPYVKIGGREIAYGTQKTINPPADIIGATHTLQAHEAIKRLFLEDTNGGTYGNITDDIYAEQFAKYVAEEPEKAAILRERAGKLRDVLRVWYNGELVDGIGVAPAEYTFFREHAYAWRFVFAEPYDKEAVETVRIELRLPEDERFTETYTFTEAGYVNGEGQLATGSPIDRPATLTYTYTVGMKPTAFRLYKMESGSDFPENGYFEATQTHNGWLPPWAKVTSRSHIERAEGDILIEYVDNGGLVSVDVRVSDKYMVDFALQTSLPISDTVIEEFVKTFVFTIDEE